METLFRYTLCGCLLVMCLVATAMIVFYAFTSVVDPYKKADRMYQAAKSRLAESVQDRSNVFIIRSWLTSGYISDTDFRNRCKQLLDKED